MNPAFSSRTITVGSLELDYLEAAGPRIVGLRYKGSANLLASVPEISIPTSYGEYHYIGGHRLWYAPEAIPRSYVPDDDGLTVSELPNGIRLQGKQEPETGIQKTIDISFNPSRPQLTIKHTLVNNGLWDVELAPWAITMFKLGGMAILPFQSEFVDMNGLLPDRHISLWPYSSIKDARLHLTDEFILVSAKPDLPLFKIGTFTPRGWIAYWNEGILFRKTFTAQSDGLYPDNGCNAEIYCDEHFIELESLAPLIKLTVGSSASHSENWEFYDNPKQDFLPEAITSLAQ